MRRFILSLTAVVLGLVACARANAQVPPAGNQFAPGLSPLAATPIPIPSQATAPFASLDRDSLKKRVAGQLLAKPDLVIDPVFVLIRGTQAQLAVKNKGTAAAGVSRLQLQAFRNNQLVASQFLALPTVAAGKSIPVTIQAAPVLLDIPGTKLVFKLDNGSQLTKVIATPALPVLIAEKVEFVLDEIRVTVRNVGGAPAGSFQVKRQFTLQGQDRGTTFFPVAGLNPGQSKTISVGLLSANPVDRLAINVDPLNQVNLARRDLTFLATPPQPQGSRTVFP